MKTILTAALLLLAALPAAMSAFAMPAAAMEVIAEPGGHQPTGGGEAPAGHCSPTPGLPADHPPVDETLSAVRAAFAAGADRVALDLQVAGGGAPVVSYGGACGTARAATSLRELLTAFPDGRFLLDLKGGARGAGQAMIDYLKAAMGGGLVRAGQLLVYSSGDEAINSEAASALPGVAAPGLVMQEAADCLAEYGQRGVFPRACQGTEIPLSIGALKNMGDYAADVMKAVHAIHARAHVLGVEDAEDYRFAAALEPDFIWTDRIDALGL